MGTNPHTVTPAGLFGDRVREERNRQRLSQKELSRRLKEMGKPLDRTMIGRIERGESTAMLDQVLSIAAAFGVPPIDLITPTDMDSVMEIGGQEVPAPQARAWIRGDVPLPGGPVAIYMSSRPRTEVRELLRRQLDRRLPSGITLAQAAAGIGVDEYDAARERAIEDVADLFDDLAAIEAARMKGEVSG